MARTGRGGERPHCAEVRHDEEGDLPGSRARSRLRGWQSAGSRRGCGQVGGQARANGRRDGIGKTSFARRAFELAQAIWTRSAHLHEGPRRVTCRIERPDTRQHLTEFAEPTKETACVYGGVHTRADWTPIGVLHVDLLRFRGVKRRRRTTSYGSRRPLTSYKPMTAAIDCPTRSAAASISRSPRWA